MKDRPERRIHHRDWVEVGLVVLLVLLLVATVVALVVMAWRW